MATRLARGPRVIAGSSPNAPRCSCRRRASILGCNTGLLYARVWPPFRLPACGRLYTARWNRNAGPCAANTRVAFSALFACYRPLCASLTPAIAHLDACHARDGFTRRGRAARFRARASARAAAPTVPFRLRCVSAPCIMIASVSAFAGAGSLNVAVRSTRPRAQQQRSSRETLAATSTHAYRQHAGPWLL